MQDFHKLKVWSKAHSLVLAVYRSTTRFPLPEVYGLTRQVRKAAASIPANIAEDCGRGSAPELSRFLRIAMGSASELEYHLLLARDLEFLKPQTHAELSQSLAEVKRMLTSLIQRVLTTEN